MKNGIPKEMYYFLLEWKDNNLQDFISRYGEVSLNSFNPSELQKMHKAIMAEKSHDAWLKIKNNYPIY